ncbi:MAG TPA: sigma-70 family RNA polymerase sigma factor [Verrucomicrobiae bacterium]|nr:sigma-70 family RNA polymerase sigma factor [Verrucomicrobiae bacterium]
MPDDSQLLRQFAANRSEIAFGELVAHHVALVYSAALRQTNGDAHLAKDIAQLVFADLARKAPALSEKILLAGWLHRATIFAARQILRTERRRQIREQEAVQMNSLSAESENADWQQIRPLLDDALNRLNQTDRDALLLRFFENQTFAQVGASLGTAEEAARKRVNRALEKLREILSRRGVTTTAAALSTVISANAIQIAPAGLAATLTTASIATAGTGTTFTFLKIMTATKLKLALSAVVVASVATAIVVQQQTQTKLRGENESLRQQIEQLQTDNENFSNRLAEIGDAKKLSDEQFNELLRLRGEVGVLRRLTNQLSKAQSENQPPSVQTSSGQNQAEQFSPEDLFELHQFHVVSAVKEIGLAIREYANDNNGQYPTNFDQIKNELVRTNFNGVPLNSIELVNIGLVSESTPNVIMLRESDPRENPYYHGIWSRVYGLADGSAQTIYGDSANAGSFNDFEQQHSPQPNQ